MPLKMDLAPPAAFKPSPLTAKTEGRRHLWVIRVMMTPVLLLLLLLLPEAILGHPQCRDSSPPFPSSSNLDLCSQFHSSGCCSPEEELTLLEFFHHVEHRLIPTDWEQCKGFVQDILCARCSPLSAHIFDRGPPSSSSHDEDHFLPGMCPDFCKAFHLKCRGSLWLLEPKYFPLFYSFSQEKFCDKMAIADPSYCSSNDKGMPKTPPESEKHDSSSSKESCVCLEPIVTGLANPIIARHAGDHSGRLFVGEQRGVVYAVDPVTKVKSDTPFLNISDRLILTPLYDERGLGGMAFHPNFASNGRVFVYYNRPWGEGDRVGEEEGKLRGHWDHVSRLSELRVNPAQPTAVDPDWERVILEMNHPFANHNGGEMFFLDDGYLYLCLGDGGYGGDPYNLAQNKSWLMGKILRLDVDTPSTDPERPNYSVPPDNPFMGPPQPASAAHPDPHPDPHPDSKPQPAARPEIFAYGVRNVWRCGVDMGDPRTGQGRDRVLCGDVGQYRFEEINVLRKGANYGWRAREGLECFDTDMCGNIGEEELPVFTYNHSVGQSVTGGQFYRGWCFPSLNGKYIFGDYQSKRLFTLQEADEGSWTSSDVTLCSSDVCSQGLTNEIQRILSFGQDQQGEVYVLTSNSSLSMTNDGGVYRIVDPFRHAKADDNCKYDS